MNVLLDYITLLLKRDCCGTSFPNVAFIRVMEEVISNSNNIYGSNLTFFLHRIFTFSKMKKTF